MIRAVPRWKLRRKRIAEPGSQRSRVRIMKAATGLAASRFISAPDSRRPSYGPRHYLHGPVDMGWVTALLAM
jgi:hypothetical protein